MKEKEILLEVSGLKTYFQDRRGQVPAVDGVDFVLHKGETLGIVGESGSGKSTLIKAAMGLLGRNGLVTRGDIWYNGHDLPDLPPKEMRKICGAQIGMIFQTAGSSFCPIRTVRVQLYEFITEHEKMGKQEFEDRAQGLLSRLFRINCVLH